MTCAAGRRAYSSLLSLYEWRNRSRPNEHKWRAQDGRGGSSGAWRQLHRGALSCGSLVVSLGLRCASRLCSSRHIGSSTALAEVNPLPGKSKQWTLRIPSVLETCHSTRPALHLVRNRLISRERSSQRKGKMNDRACGPYADLM